MTLVTRPRWPGWLTGVLDEVVPRTGKKQRRVTVTVGLKTAFYVAVVLAAVFTFVVFVLWADDTTIPEIPATRDADVVQLQVENYLKNSTHRGLEKQDEPVTCWDTFSDKEFKTEYKNYGSWLVDAFYEKVRYFWRVDDLTLEVIEDDRLQSNPNLLRRSHFPTIDC